MNRSHKIKIVVFSGMMLMLVAPLIQKLGVFTFEELKGQKELAKKPVFSDTAWFSGNFQKTENKYIDANLGFREPLIRLINQIKWAVYGVSERSWVIKGRDNELYSYSSIENYNGGNYVGDDIINQNVSNIKLITEALKNRYNIDLIVVFAPGKASFYPEKIPWYLDGYHKPENNYEKYFAAFAKEKINFLDLNSWFKKIKTSTPYPLYPINGTHWSSYGAYLTIDTLTKYIENKTNIDLPEIKKDQVIISEQMQGADYDLGELLNVIKEPKNKPMPYVTVSYTSAGKQKINTLVIADSYWFGIQEHKMAQSVFENDEFWFYNKDVYKNGANTGVNPNSLNIMDEVKKHRCIILIASESTYGLFPFGFIEKISKEGDLLTDDQWMDNCKNEIKRNKEWMLQIVKKAKENKVSVEEMITRDAQYMLSVKKEKYGEVDLSDEQWIANCKNEIRNNKDWMLQIVKKAKENKVSVEEMIGLDAKFMLDEKKKKGKDNGLSDEQWLKNCKNEIRNNKDWMLQIEKKAKQNKVSVEEMIELDAKFMLSEKKKKEGQH
ncbi:MAG: hypothetical protein Q8M29_11095 [Bacteroidota bacterium]|nr:hypothetical protein [Bacteroidota bacterium]